MKGYVVAYDERSGTQSAFRAKRRDALLASIDIFFKPGTMEPHPTIAEWRCWECGSGRDITMQLLREREMKLPPALALGPAETPEPEAEAQDWPDRLAEADRQAEALVEADQLQLDPTGTTA